jgi:hypothetical protein
VAYVAGEACLACETWHRVGMSNTEQKSERGRNS